MPDDFYNLSNKTEDGYKYAPNFHKKVLDLIDPPKETKHVGPKVDSCCYCPVKLRLIYVLSIDAVLSFLHFLAFYMIDNYEFFRLQTFHHTLTANIHNEAGELIEQVEEVNLNYVDITNSVNETKDEYDDDLIEELKYKSKFAFSIKDQSSIIQEFCGEKYYTLYLVQDNLKTTEAIFRTLCRKGMYSSIGYICFDVFYLFLLGVCSTRSGGKVLLILTWILQFPPLFILMQVILYLQSRRLCILEYGSSIRPQATGTIYLFIVIIFFKCTYLLRATSFYIMKLVQTKIFPSLNETANVYMSRTDPAYQKYFSEKEATIVPQTHVIVPGTYRLGVKEIPYGQEDISEKNNLPRKSSKNKSSLLSLSSIKVTSKSKRSSASSVKKAKQTKTKSKKNKK